MRIARTPEERRSLFVLRADILFSVGRMDVACTLYEEASSIHRTRWVDRQTGYCSRFRKETAEQQEPTPTEEQG
jgi:hypothetical protein